MPTGIYTRKPRTEESKLKIRAVLSIRNKSDKQKNAVSLAHKGLKHTEEAKRKISIGHTGKILSNETRKRISESSKKGEANHFWKGGVSKEKKYKHYYSFEYTTWRRAIFERDGYRCQVCCQVGGYLTAHHIKSWAHYPELRYDINNGITLCESCHMKIDNYKGRGRKINKILPCHH